MLAERILDQQRHDSYILEAIIQAVFTSRRIRRSYPSGRRTIRGVSQVSLYNDRTNSFNFMKSGTPRPVTGSQPAVAFQ